MLIFPNLQISSDSTIFYVIQNGRLFHKYRMHHHLSVAWTVATVHHTGTDLIIMAEHRPKSLQKVFAPRNNGDAIHFYHQTRLDGFRIKLIVH